MCTLVLVRTPNVPLLIGATRDERPDRPTTPPSYGTPEVFSPRDEVFGGTWLGVNTHGVLVALINNDVADEKHKTGGPRADLINTCLHASSVTDALEHAWTASDASIRGYYMVIADKDEAFLVWHEGHDKGFKTLPSLAIITTMGTEEGHCPREKGIRKRLKDRPMAPQTLQEAMKFHGINDPEKGACVHGEGVTMESTFHMTVMIPPTNLNTWVISWKAGRTCGTGEYTHEIVPIK